MDIAAAKYLIEGSIKCSLIWSGHRQVQIECPLPTLEELILCEFGGGRTAYSEDGGRMLFDMGKVCETNLITEDPERIAKKYPRQDFSTVVFLGDADGYFLSRNAENHADLFRELIKSGVADKAKKGLIINYNLPRGVEMIGKPRKIDFDYSGIVMPKQSGVDATYISGWAPVSINELIVNWARKHYDPPFKRDVADKNGEFVVSDI